MTETAIIAGTFISLIPPWVYAVGIVLGLAVILYLGDMHDKQRNRPLKPPIDSGMR